MSGSKRGTRGSHGKVRRARRGAALTAIVGAAAVAAGALGLHSKTASAAEPGQPSPRWQQLTAGQIFPRTVDYTSTSTSDGTPSSASRAGIARQASCAAAVDPVIRNILTRAGCQTMLRATYTDYSGTLVATAGIAVMPNRAAAVSAYQAMQAYPDAGVLAVRFPGTDTDLFGNGQRAVFAVQDQGVYMFFAAVGFADGRVTHTDIAGGENAPLDLGQGLMDALAGVLIPGANS